MILLWALESEWCAQPLSSFDAIPITRPPRTRNTRRTFANPSMIYNPNMQKMMTTRPRCKENDKIGIVEINPDLVAQIDQKLLSQILKLITEK